MLARRRRPQWKRLRTTTRLLGDNARMTTPDNLIDDLVAANRILAGLAVLDGFGHVSVRHPDDRNRFLLSRSLAPELVTRDDVMTFDLDSNPLDGDKRVPYLERFIHGAIYARRADVNAVIHSHSASVVPFAASSVTLKPIYHMSGFLRGGAPVFEIRKKFGMTDMLIRNGAQGHALAESLSGDAVVLMRGHGFCTVGDTLPIAVFRAVYTQSNAALQQQAIALGGEVTFLDVEEALRAEETNRRVVSRPWELWKAKFAP
jgi:ribulose-5-phosphate 4-epimerase/fuculose-1-phosphate aldolase